MKKFTLLLLVLCMSSFPQFLQAQDYAVDSYIANANLSPTRKGKRYCKGVSLTPQESTVAYGAKQTISFNEGISVSSSSDNGPNYKIYNDLTATSDGFSLKTGQTVNGSFDIGNQDGVWDGYWMGSYIYIDANQNKIFDASNELFRSSGSTYTGSNVVNSVSEFRLPTTAGQYRMRFIIAWPEQFNTLPAGSSGISSDGGCITDVTLNLVDPVVSVSNNDAKGTVTLPGSAICGNDYSFTVEAKAGYSVGSVVVRCGENLDEAASENVTWMAITPTISGNTYTVSGANFQGDMKIIVTYTFNTDVDLIKQGKQVFRLKNRKYTASPYLKVAKSDVKSNVRPYDVGDAILYHVNEIGRNAAGASCLWRLVPVSGSSNRYYLRSQNANASDLHSGDDYPIKMTENGSELYLVQSSSYYGLGTSDSKSNTDFLHAVEFGKSKHDGNGKYVDTRNGDYVTTWKFQENGSDTEASQWTFEAVDEIDITIGASGYASVNYDFPVKFPAGVKVYKKALEAATYIKLEEIAAGTDGCVSLHTGNAAFVAGTEGASITLSILSDEPDNIDTGVNGTYLATKFEEGDAANIYGIAKVNDVVAFYKMQGGTTIKQNKGYIRSTSSNAPRMELTFGEGETTGIESVLEDNSRRESIDTSVLYDLNGRRVLYPSRGIYVTAGGQRIFLK